MPTDIPPEAVITNYEKALELVEFIKNEINKIENDLENKALQQENKKLGDENEKLKVELSMWQNEVTNQEIQLGIKQVPLPSSSLAEAVKNISSDQEHGVKVAEDSSLTQEKPKEKKEKKKAAAKPAKLQEAQKADNADEVHIGRFDLRIGRIMSAQKHPEADSLYLEQIDLGEEKPRTVVSGLVKFVPLEEMQNRLVMVLCNLKPVKMRGILSEAMVMCASTPEKVEILNPPADAIPGDCVVCDDFPSKPDPVLNPKKKVLEQVLADLKTNADCVAVYKDSALKVSTKGVIKSVTLAGVQIK